MLVNFPAPSWGGGGRVLLGGNGFTRGTEGRLQGIIRTLSLFHALSLFHHLVCSTRFVFSCQGYRPAGGDQESEECHGCRLWPRTTHTSSRSPPEVGGAREVRCVGWGGCDFLTQFLLTFPMVEGAGRSLPAPSPITNSPTVPRPLHSTSTGLRPWH